MPRNLQLRLIMLQQLQSINNSSSLNLDLTPIIESLLNAIIREIRELLGEGNSGTDSDIASRLQDLVGRQIEVTTAFAPVSGTLSSVQTDYIVLADGASSIYVPLASIEAFSTLN